MTRYRVTYIDPDGRAIAEQEIEYDVMAHESAPHIIPEARIKLVIDAAEFGTYPSGRLSAHIGPGYVEAVLIDPRTVLVCHEDFIHKTADGDWSPNTHEKVKHCGRVYGEQAAKAYGDPRMNPYPFAGPVVLIEELA